jgi:hypothetical protein
MKPEKIASSADTRDNGGNESGAEEHFRLIFLSFFFNECC